MPIFSRNYRSIPTLNSWSWSTQLQRRWRCNFYLYNKQRRIHCIWTGDRMV